ncbi:MAG: CPBP family glutamic-type intramembrane protease [Prolixibacteraceae bacterium]|jgi:membrane protease YdiL (CAAX protease family)|nr:CPBP family glutamic-type intramembrane protease [Prolixibacteraceae bacterium]
MQELIAFFLFLKNPKYHDIEKRETIVLKTAFRVFLITFLVLTLINGLIHFMLGLFFILPNDRLQEIFESMKIGPWAVFAIIVFIGPALEEIIFRLPLVFKIQFFSIILAILIGVIIHYFIPYLPGFIVILLLFFIFSHFVPKHEKRIFDIWVRYFRFVVWFSAITFGLFHIGNFELVKASQYFIVPFLVIPQLGMGFVLSFVRLTYRQGFLIGLLVHIFINFVPATIYLFQT